MSKKRVFLIVLDSFGIGSLPDYEKYDDEYSNTLKAVLTAGPVSGLKNLKKMGLFNIDGLGDIGEKTKGVLGAYARMAEAGAGKDTTTGHWEIAGNISQTPLPTYPNGFPAEIIAELEEKTGHKVICNKPYSGTQLLLDYGEEHEKTGALIVYTSADSVCQIAAHEDIVPLEDLYKYCEIAREILQGPHAVGRIIARPFVGEYPNYTRTSNRRDISLPPPGKNMLDALAEAQLDVIGVGKIYDIFAGRSVTEKIKTKNNTEGIEKTLELLERDFEGLAFVNLVDFDMLYGHRNDPLGYYNALKEFDDALEKIATGLKEDDLLIITADHGCDPVTISTDHSREYVPLLAYSPKMKKSVNLGTRGTFADTAATICSCYKLDNPADGISYLAELFL